MTAATVPGLFADDLIFARRPLVAAMLLILFMAVGFALRVHNLGAESLGEDEFNKLETVNSYRKDGLSGKNGEHPFLMKGLQTVSMVAASKINDSITSPDSKISDEAALRFPVALFGSLTPLLIFLLISEIFGRSIGLVSSILWAVEPMAVGFDRIAKEDSLALFFFLLTLLFWVKAQTAAELGRRNWTNYLWLASIAFGGMMASKYYPHLLAVAAAYYMIFQSNPETKWRLERVRWMKFILLSGFAFIILSPTILLPDTWKEMLKFSSENRIGHDSYEYWGVLYTNKMSAWLAGVPWTFYYVFAAVKSSFSTILLFMIGIPIMFLRRLGDGRFLVLAWAFYWFIPYSVMGGKFTRYFAMAEPLILIVAAVAFYFSLMWLKEKFAAQSVLPSVLQVALLAVIVAFPLWNSVSYSPHFRLFTNTLGGGAVAAGSYFPHDEFYDASTKDIVAKISEQAANGARVLCETPALFEYYARKSGREDLDFGSLSEVDKIGGLAVGDFIVLARGRRYRSNQAFFDYFEKSAVPSAETKLGEVISTRIYKLDENQVTQVKKLIK
ncbi:hypothetical protein BH10ACI2_BH10ACI2_14290 [soil metagenome]